MPHSTRRRIALGLRKLRNKQLENPWKKHDNIPLMSGSSDCLLLGVCGTARIDYPDSDTALGGGHRRLSSRHEAGACGGSWMQS